MTPKGWRLLPLSAFLKQASTMVDVHPETDYPLLGVRWYGMGCHQHDTVLGGRLKTPTLNRVEAGNVIYNKMWVKKGAFAVVRPEQDGLFATSEYPAFRCVPDRACSDFLRWALTSSDFVRSASELCRGTTSRARLNPKDFLSLSVQLPPLPEQRKIAAILSSIDDAMQASQAVIDQLQVVKKAMMAELLTRGLPGRHTRFKQTEIGKVPEEWGTARIGEVCELSSGGTPSRDRPDYWNGGVPWVKTGEINYGQITSTEETISAAGVANSSAKVIRAGAVLLAMYGQGATRGRAAILGIDAALNQACLALVPGAQLDSRFLFHTLNHLYQYLRGLGHEGTQKNLNAGLVKDVLIPIPALSEQREMARLLDSVDARIRSGHEERAVHLAVKSALMSVLLTGEVRVKPDEEDA